MKINFVGKHYHDITFIPQWITKNVLGDWKEVKNFTLNSVEEYSVKSYVVEGTVTYDFENGETHPMKFFCPINHFNIEKAREYFANDSLDSLGEPAQKASAENITIDELPEAEKVKVEPEKFALNEIAVKEYIKGYAEEYKNINKAKSINEIEAEKAAKAEVEKRLSLGEIEILIGEHNEKNGTDLVIVSGSVFEKISADYVKFERFLFDEKIKEEKKLEKKNKKAKPELEVETPEFEGEDDDQEDDEE